MNIRILLTQLALLACIAVNAQSPAAQVKVIQKNTAAYINTESTDPNEEAAYSNALNQMIEMARNFVNTNKDGADISDASIEAVVKKIVIPRGEFKRVFLYAKRDDLLANSGSNNLITASEQPEKRNESKLSENTGKDESIEISNSNLSSIEEEIQIESQTETSSDVNKIETPEEFENSVPEEIVVNVRKSSNVPVGIKELISQLQKCNSLIEATRILERYKSRRNVSAYGVSKEAHNSKASYWVVEDNGVISVLGPEIRGHRNNFRTGKTDALHRYKKGVWFRKR